MLSIPLLGGPRDGELVQVPATPPPTIEREEWMSKSPGEVPMGIRIWARSYGYAMPMLMHRVPPQVTSAYEIYKRWVGAGSQARLMVQYRLVYWGTPWRLHYVHPQHVAAPLAEAL